MASRDPAADLYRRLNFWREEYEPMNLDGIKDKTVIDFVRSLESVRDCRERLQRDMRIAKFGSHQEYLYRERLYDDYLALLSILSTPPSQDSPPQSPTLEHRAFLAPQPPVPVDQTDSLPGSPRHYI